MIKITNKGKGIYIGRPSPLGNPYIIGKDGTREEVIVKYEIWLRKKIKISKSYQMIMLHLCDIARKMDLKLSCHCKPLPCHGDIIKKILEEMINETS